MIISLFMDETPLVCGSGETFGMCARIPPAGEKPDPRDHRGDDQCEHDHHAWDVHESAADGKS
jgi:hypothetical protein